MLPALHIQIINTRWTKNSRGGEGATLRNRVPWSLPVDSKDIRRGALSVQGFIFGEPDFQTPFFDKSQQLDLEASLRFQQGAFSLDWDGCDATTGYEWSWWSGGAPTPESLAPNAARLVVPADEWVQLRYQGRFSDMDEGKWWYERFVVNIARCDKTLEVNFSSLPARVFERLPHLR